MSILDRLHQASFRGVKFYTEGWLSVEGGRKIVPHDFAKRETNIRYHEDMGKLPRTFSINGVIGNDNFFTQKKRLIEALEKEGPGILKHPFFGSITVIALPYVEDLDMQKVGEARFSMTFETTTKKANPTKKNFNFIKLLNDALDASESLLSGEWLINDSGNLIIVGDTIIDVIDTFDNMSRIINVATDTISSFSSIIADARGSISNLLLSGSTLGLTIKSLFTNARVLATSPFSQYELFKSMFNYSTEEIINPTTMPLIELKKHNELLKQVINANAIACAYMSAIKIDFETDIQLNKTVEELKKQYDFIVDILDDSVLNAIQELRIEFFKYIETLNVAKIIEIETPDIPLMVLCHKYYGNLDNYDKLMELNDIINPACVSGKIKVLSK